MLGIRHRQVNPGRSAVRLAAVQAVVELAACEEDLDVAFAALRALGVSEAELACVRVSVAV